MRPPGGATYRAPRSLGLRLVRVELRFAERARARARVGVGVVVRVRARVIGYFQD